MYPVARAFLVAMIVATLAGCDRTSADQHLRNAEERYSRGEVREAVIELRNALNKQPDLAEARVLFGEAQAHLGDHARALREFERALDLGLDNDRVQAGLLHSKLRLGRYHEVLGELEGNGPLSAPFAVILGDAYLEAGDLEKASTLYNQAPDRAGAQLGLGTLAWRANELETASEHLQAAVELDPDSVEAWLQKGEFDLARRNYDSANSAFSEAAAHPAGEVLGTLGLARTLLAQGKVDAAHDHVALLLRRAPELPIVHYLDGLVRFEQQDIAGAEAAIEKLESLAPEYAQGLHLMGTIKYRQGQLGEAEDYLKRFIAQAPRNESAVKLLATVHFDQGEFAQVVELLEQPRQTTSDPQILAIYGTAQLRLGRPGKAAEALEAAVALAPDRAPFRNQLALSLAAAGDRGRAEAELQSAIAIDGNQLRSDYLIAMLHLREEDWDGARAAVDALIQKSPDSPMGYNLRGAIAVAEGNDRAAVKAFEDALERDETFLPAVRNLAQLHERAGNLDQAAQRYHAYLDVQPDHEPALTALARMYLRNKELEKAGRLVDSLMAAGNSDADTRMLQADILLAEGKRQDAEPLLLALAEEGNRDALMRLTRLDLAAGDRDAAVTRLESWLEEHPNDQGTQMLLADALMIADPERALAMYEALAESGNPVVLNNLAWLYMERDDERAVDIAQRAHAAAPDNPDVLDTLGWILLQRGRVDEAVAHLQRSTQLNPDNPTIQYHLGVALEQAGELDDAQIALSRALEVDAFPERDAAEHVLRSLSL